MASAIARGQITIVDLNDGKSINLFLSSNQPATQIFNKENSSYNPNYASSPFLVITPEIYVSGATGNQVAQLAGTPTWKINGSTDLTAYAATASETSPYELKIKKNLESITQMVIECTVTYVDPETSARTIAKATYTVTKVENTGQQIRAVCYAPNGSVFKNGITGTLTAHCDLWRGSTIDTTNVVYSWYRLEEGTWTKLIATNTYGITGCTTNEITIPASAILNIDSFKCVVRDTDSASGTYGSEVSDILTFADMTDPYMVEIQAPQGTTLTSGMTSTTLTVNLWQNGMQLDDSFFTDATVKWKKFNKLGVQDTSWGSSGTKTGRSITVTRDEISVAATFIVEISK